MNNWHARDISDLVLESGTDLNSGRPARNSSYKRKKDNKIFLLPQTDSFSIIKKMASDASLILLAIAYAISAFVVPHIDSLIGIVLVICFFALGSYIKYRSSLRITNSYRLLLPDATVVEGGNTMRLTAFDVEINDLITFCKGDIITADARLVSSTSLIVAERSLNDLTGKYEYKRLQKDHLQISALDESLHAPNMVYAGSMVISGKGSAIVTAIGNETEICKNHSAISIVPENDRPLFLEAFEKKSRSFSLAILLSVIPIFLLGILLPSLSGKNEGDYLSTFILLLALATTSMSELTVSSAEAIVTKELLPSSVVSKSDKRLSSKLTKLSSAENLALTDTFLILAPDVLIDERQLVRRVFFAGKQYRYDAIYSKYVRDFAKQIAPYFSYMPRSSAKINDRIISEFLAHFNDIAVDKANSVKFFKNFPGKESRSCVFGFDESGRPINYITCSTDISLLRHCSSFRTEGGGLWKLSAEDFDEAETFFLQCSASDFLTPIAFYSHVPEDDALILEGIICVGEEFPYSDGEILEELYEAGIHPILVLETENPRAIEIVNNCGLLKTRNDVAFCSEYQKAGLSVSDAQKSTKIYVGFGRDGTRAIAKRLADNSNNVLPIIKDSANKYDTASSGIYATSFKKSLDSVKISSSLSIVPNITETKVGGVRDALNSVQACSMAFLKLGVYKNYLVFASLLKIFSVVLPMFLGYSHSIVSSNAILFGGFFCDFAALLSIAYFKGVPVKAKNAIIKTKKLFSLSSSLTIAFLALILSCLVLCIVGYLTKTEVVMKTQAHLLVAGLTTSVLIAAIGGFLLVLHGQTRIHRFNACYLCIVIIVLLLLVSTILYENIALSIGISLIQPNLIPHFASVSLLSLVSIVLIGNLSSFSLSKHV